MKQVFSVYDSKAEFFGDPMFFRTIGEAMRGWFSACKGDGGGEGGDLQRYPADFTFFHIGTFDPDTAELVALENGKVNYGTALEAIPLESRSSDSIGSGSGDQIDLLMPREA